MSLNWLTAVADMDNIITEENWPITEAIIILTMQVGIGELTDDTLDEFYLRTKIAEKMLGAFVGSEDGPHLITYDELAKRVGLKCNVTFERRAAWSRRMMNHLFDVESRRLERDRESTVTAR